MWSKLSSRPRIDMQAPHRACRLLAGTGSQRVPGQTVRQGFGSSMQVKELERRKENPFNIARRASDTLPAPAPVTNATSQLFNLRIQPSDASHCLFRAPRAQLCRSGSPNATPSAAASPRRAGAFAVKETDDTTPIGKRTHRERTPSWRTIRTDSRHTRSHRPPPTARMASPRRTCGCRCWTRLPARSVSPRRTWCCWEAPSIPSASSSNLCPPPNHAVPSTDTALACHRSPTASPWATPTTMSSTPTRKTHWRACRSTLSPARRQRLPSC